MAGRIIGEFTVRVWLRSGARFDATLEELDPASHEEALDHAYRFLNEDCREGVPIFDTEGRAWRLTQDTRIDALKLIQTREAT